MGKEEHTPTAAQFRGLIAWMEAHIPAGTEFVMPKCTACVAGTIGRIAEGLGLIDVSLCPEEADNATFGRGRQFIAEQLGFEDGGYLESWADRNPDIWGNEDGIGMFGGYTWAYEKPRHEKAYTPTSVVSREQVLTHLEGVAQRLEARERQEGAGKPATDYDFTPWLEELIPA